jgi:excisionase family DNA binding protein
MSSTFLTARDIAHVLRISRSLAYRLIAQCEIPSIQFGRVSRVRQEDLDTFIQKRMRKRDTDATARLDAYHEPAEKGEIQQNP